MTERDTPRSGRIPKHMTGIKVDPNSTNDAKKMRMLDEIRTSNQDLQRKQIKLGRKMEKRPFSRKYSKTREGKNVFGRKDRRRWPRCRRCGWKGHNSATCAIVDVEKDGNPFRQEHWDQIELDRKVGNAIQGARRQADARVKAIRRMREREKDAQRREKIKEKEKNELIAALKKKWEVVHKEY